MNNNITPPKTWSQECGCSGALPDKIDSLDQQMKELQVQNKELQAQIKELEKNVQSIWKYVRFLLDSVPDDALVNV